MTLLVDTSATEILEFSNGFVISKIECLVSMRLSDRSEIKNQHKVKFPFLKNRIVLFTSFAFCTILVCMSCG